MIKAGIAVLALLTTAFSWQPPKHIKIYLIGDSTMCLYDRAQLPVTGWGMPFADYMDTTVTISNQARAGRSTRTFLAENRWTPVVDSLQKGDYVLIQFGHNDEAAEPKYADRYTTIPDYRKNLIKFIVETRVREAVPVLITPVTRRSYDSSGQIKETHAGYSDAVREVGKTYSVPVIDLDERSRELMQRLGPDVAEMLYIGVKAGENPNYPNGKKDNTHFNEYGARCIAELVMNEMKALHIGLAQRIVNPKALSK